MSSLSTANRQGISADCFDVTRKQADETTHMFAWTWMTSKQMTHLTCLLWHDWQASWWRTSLIASKQVSHVKELWTDWLGLTCLFAQIKLHLEDCAGPLFISGCKKHACTKCRSSFPGTVTVQAIMAWLVILYSQCAPTAAYTHFVHMRRLLRHGGVTKTSTSA